MLVDGRGPWAHARAGLGPADGEHRAATRGGDERFLREGGIWRKIWDEDRGRYILPFYGACHDDGPYPYMVSPWMSNGDALSYVKKYPYVDRKMIVGTCEICVFGSVAHTHRIPQVRRIADGLRLLHTQKPPIAHGGIKAVRQN